MKTTIYLTFALLLSIRSTGLYAAEAPTTLKIITHNVWYGFTKKSGDSIGAIHQMTKSQTLSNERSITGVAELARVRIPRVFPSLATSATIKLDSYFSVVPKLVKMGKTARL